MISCNHLIIWPSFDCLVSMPNQWISRYVAFIDKNIFCFLFSEPEYKFRVDRENFFPRPKVIYFLHVCLSLGNNILLFPSGFGFKSILFLANSIRRLMVLLSASN